MGAHYMQISQRLNLTLKTTFLLSIFAELNGYIVRHLGMYFTLLQSTIIPV